MKEAHSPDMMLKIAVYYRCRSQ